VGDRRLGNRTLQRRVGFELEDNSWHPWQIKRRWNGREVVVPVPRQASIDKGYCFEVQADSTPGPTRSNIEFVTKPFDETMEGLREAKLAFEGMSGIYGRLKSKRSRDGPFDLLLENMALQPPYGYQPEKYVGPGEHGMSEGTVKAGELALSHDAWIKTGDTIRLQVTSGLVLRELPAVMEYFGTHVPGESESERQDRDPGRVALKDSPANVANLRLLGNVPSLARTVVGQFDGNYALPGAHDDLVGFVTAVMYAIKALQFETSEEIKSRLSLMNRTSFAEMFSAVPTDQRAVVKKHWADLLSRILVASNGTPLVAMGTGKPLLDARLGATSPLINAVTAEHRTLRWLTIDTWFKNIVLSGVDYLLPSEQHRRSYGPGGKKKAMGVLLSMGSIPKLDTSQAGYSLAVFENRFIHPNPEPRELTFRDAYTVAWNQLIFYKQLRDVRTGRRASLGPYPAYDAGELPVAD
jgi:hypothetical protein